MAVSLDTRRRGRSSAVCGLPDYETVSLGDTQRLERICLDGQVTARDGEVKQNGRETLAEICANIRALDDNSFKLLSFVPLVSGRLLWRSPEGRSRFVMDHDLALACGALYLRPYDGNSAISRLQVVQNAPARWT